MGGPMTVLPCFRAFRVWRAVLASKEPGGPGIVIDMRLNRPYDALHGGGHHAEMCLLREGERQPVG